MRTMISLNQRSIPHSKVSILYLNLYSQTIGWSLTEQPVFLGSCWHIHNLATLDSIAFIAVTLYNFQVAHPYKIHWSLCEHNLVMWPSPCESDIFFLCSCLHCSLACSLHLQWVQCWLAVLIPMKPVGILHFTPHIPLRCTWNGVTSFKNSSSITSWHKLRSQWQHLWSHMLVCNLYFRYVVLVNHNCN